MAKKTKKAAVKKAASKKAATKKATAKKAAPKKAVKKAATPPPPPVTRGLRRGGNFRGGAMEAVEGMVVVLTVTFSGVAEDNSSITASFNGEESSRTSSGKITFSGVQKDDLIGIDVSSPGDIKIEINVPASPQEMNFSKGNFNDTFVIN